MGREPGTPIVVFCMSKTASTAVRRAVRDAVSRPVHKIHLLLPSSIERAEAEYRRTDRGIRPRHIFHASYLVDRLPTPERPWLVISIVREPVMRSVSEFFQSGDRMHRLVDEDTTLDLLRRYVTDVGIPRTLEWFERELEPSLGIDVYAHPFDRERGFGMFDTPAARMLLLRQESLEGAPEALADFLGLPAPVEIDRKNEGAEKEYSALYRSVLDRVRFPEATLDLAYGSRFAQHFYTPAQLESFRARWSGRADGDRTSGPERDR